VQYFFETYGCQMNTAESAALELACRERGWTLAPEGESADLVLLNTCSVRLTAEQRVFGRLALYSSIKKKKRGTAPALVVAGCMAQRLGQGLREKFPAVDYVMGTQSRSIFPLILSEVEKNVEAQTGHSLSSPDTALPSEAALPPEAALLPDAPAPQFSFSRSHHEEGHFRSFIPIMHGCNNFCSYCIVPYVRGREISRDPRFIAEEIRLVAERGVKEITLLGQNVNSYCWKGTRKEFSPRSNTEFHGEKGDKNSRLRETPCTPWLNSSLDTSLDFPGLLRLVAGEARKNGIRWVRFLSANPKDFSGETIRVMADNPVFCRHLHLCVQHGSNRVVAAMNRRYTREQYLKLVGEIRAATPTISFSTDILVGFPGETEEDLEQTLSLMEEVKFLYAYMYHYNPREGTAAYDLPGRISEEVKRERLSRVIALQKKHTTGLLKSRIGARELVLVEGISRKNADDLITRTERDEMVAVPGKARHIGSFAELTITSLRGNTFRAKELHLCPGV
jgi:tRNA-2-methylthio-N6-dimethylallyladenosine synthase